MQIFDKSSLLKSFVILKKKQKKSIGFVPTMGSLHDGHLSLIRKSKLENDITIVSIYVNPLQFDDKNDFANYPVSNKQDIKLLKEINCDALFAPKTRDMYKGGFNLIKLQLGNLDKILESKKRPGHFQGVIFIVHKFLKIINPDRAYFGEKDYQQLLIVKELASVYFPNIVIVACPTMRDQEGLAMSSRNKKLTKKQLDIAKKVFNLLKFTEKLFKEVGVQKAKCFVNDFFNKNEKINLDYFEVIEDSNFYITNILKNNKKYRIMIAFKIDNVRLIDNIKLEL